MAARMDNVKVPVTFVYGDKDWMSPEGGMEACKRMRANGNKNVETVIIAKAGHHLYCDAPEPTNKLLEEQLGAGGSCMSWTRNLKLSSKAW